MNIIRLLKVADLLTVANLCCGLLSIFFSSKASFAVSALLILLAVIFDFLDGRVAALLHQRHAFGKQLDSLSDLVSFGVAPAFFYFSMSSKSLLVMAVLLFFVVCGMLRLARYNISKRKHFEGLPTTVNGVLFPLLYFVSLFLPLILYLWPILFVAMGLLMASRIKVRRMC
jgi:CDP-diacylglycerol--serine O-phosphatidyltransferase